jgi:hypothetical protein
MHNNNPKKATVCLGNNDTLYKTAPVKFHQQRWRTMSKGNKCSHTSMNCLGIDWVMWQILALVSALFAVAPAKKYVCDWLERGMRK